MNKKYVILMGFLLASSVCEKVWAADSGSCGDNCQYTYDPTTETLTFTGTGENGSGVINRSTHLYGLSGTVKNAIVSEGITAVIFPGNAHNTLREIGTTDGKLVIPSTVTEFNNGASWRLGFGTVEINSKNLNLTKGSLSFAYAPNAKIILSSDANIKIDDNAFLTWTGWELPTTLDISCRGDPDACLSKFGDSLNRMNQNNIHADYYAEYDENENLMLKYDDTGYNKYDIEGNVIERWNLDNTEQYDGKGNLIAQYDKNGNLLKSFVYGADKSVAIYGSDGKLIGIQGKRILTVDEATALVKDNKNTFKLKYR